jgi:tRNA 2-selenouridine synthase
LFDSKLVAALEGFDRSRPVWVEAESPRLGDVHLPSALYAAMIAAPRITLDLDRAARAAAIIRDYAPWLYDPERIVEQLQRLAPLHPRARIEEWQNWARARDFRALIDGLLDHHYDPLYKKTRYTRPPIRHVVIKETTPSAIDQLAASLLSDDKIKKVLGPDPRTHR